MSLKVLIHPVEEGGFWAEIPTLLGCISEGILTEKPSPISGKLPRAGWKPPPNAKLAVNPESSFLLVALAK
jgi:hypothetical protein